MKKLAFLVLVLIFLLSFAACAAQQPSTTTTAPIHEHTFEIRDIRESTCEEQGYARYVCTCGAENIQYQDALGHDYTCYVSKEPQCNEQGEMTYACHCGHTYTEPIETAEHNWGNWFVDVTPTFTTTGQEKHICTVCNEFETREVPTNTIEQELKRLATLASLLPYFETTEALTANHDLFDWVRVQAGTVSSEFNESTYQVTNVYSLEAFDAVTQLYFGRTYDFVSFAQKNENMTVDTEKNQLIWVTYGAGGWMLTGFDSVKQDGNLYSIRYYNYYEENTPLSYGTLNVKFTGYGFVFESHHSEG